MILYTQTKVNLEIKYKHVCFVVCRGITWHNLRRKGSTSSKNQTMQLERELYSHNVNQPLLRTNSSIN